MPEKSRMSKVFAAVFVVLTISLICGIVTLTILYKSQIDILNPTPPPTFSSTTMAPPVNMRLPKNLVPESYEVFIQPDFYTRIIEEVNVTSPNQTMLFTGNSTVHFHCIQGTRSIYLHSMDLTLSNPFVRNEDTNELIGVSHMEQPEDFNTFLSVNLEEALEAGGNYSLFLAFEGRISDNFEALYKNTYVEGDSKLEENVNATRYLVATQFEPRDARRLFPCFDEPAMKAEFHVTVIHRRTTSALGNSGILVSNIIDDEWKYTRFYPTPRMSTYLLAFTVSEFTSIPSPHERVEIKTYARPEATEKGHTKYAASITGRTLMFFEKLFEIDYTLKKLDQIALPYLEFAGMENWGLITYGENELLFEEGVSPLLNKEDITTLIAHELAHQWFGNLVTMKWWNNLWLKEGFATYFSFSAVDYVEPMFKMKDTLVLEALRFAFKADSFISSRPLSLPEEFQINYTIRELYDDIPYCKGASVLRMLADFVGENVFNTGVKMYLKAFQSESTDPNDLWECIQKADSGSAIPIAKLMDPWIHQIGYPVLTINTTSGAIYQKHFLFNNTAESSLWWQIPIRFMSDTSDASLVLLDVKGPVMKEEFISKSGDWMLMNVNCTGYYRVNYNPENWERLLTQLERDPQRIPPMNRGQLIDDAFNLARANLVNVTLALNSTRFLSKERAFIPWDSAMMNLEYFVNMFDRSEVYGPMQTYLQHQVKGLYNFYKNETDNSSVPHDHASQHNQITAISVACSNGLPECIEMVKSQFSNWMRSNSTNSIHPNLRAVIYCQAVAAGGKEEWDFAWDQYQSSNDMSEREQLRYALTCTKEIWLLNRYLAYTLDPEKIDFTNVVGIIFNIAMNTAGQALAWNFIRAHWDYLSENIDQGSLIAGVTDRFSTQFELDELERFVKDYNVSSVEQAIEQIQVNIKWVRENKDVVLHWFEQETAGLAKIKQ